LAKQGGGGILTTSWAELQFYQLRWGSAKIQNNEKDFNLVVSQEWGSFLGIRKLRGGSAKKIKSWKINLLNMGGGSEMPIKYNLPKFVRRRGRGEGGSVRGVMFSTKKKSMGVGVKEKNRK